MGYNIDEELAKWVDEEVTISGSTRKKMDDTFEQIRLSKPSNISKVKWIKTISIASIAALSMVLLFQNEKVVATLNEWLNFSNQWKNSLGDGVLIGNGQEKTDDNLEISINQNMSTPYSLGFDFTLKNLGKDTFSKQSHVWFDYIIQNSDGETIVMETNEDSRIGDGQVSAYQQALDVSVSSDGKSIQSGYYYFLNDSQSKKLPLLSGAKIKISKVVVSSPEKDVEFVGDWTIPLKDGNTAMDYSFVNYKVEKEVPGIKVKSAELTNSHFIIEYEFDKEKGINDMELLKTYIQDVNGRKYHTNSYSLENNNTVVRVTLPLTSSKVPEKMTLVVEQLAEESKNSEFKYDIPLVRE